MSDDRLPIDGHVQLNFLDHTDAGVIRLGVEPDQERVYGDDPRLSNDELIEQLGGEATDLPWHPEAGR